MEGIFRGNSDIELYPTEEEFNNISIPTLETKDNKQTEKYKPLECTLKSPHHPGLERKARLQYEDFDSVGDGIEVNFKDDTYFVKINNHASNLISERDSFGTRHGLGEWITIYILERIDESRRHFLDMTEKL